MISFKKIYYSFFKKRLVKKIWEKAQVIENMDPDLYRLDHCGALIKKELLCAKRQPLSMVWEIDLIKPKKQGGKEELSNMQALQWENKKAKAESFLYWRSVVKANGKANYQLKEVVYKLKNKK